MGPRKSRGGPILRTENPGAPATVWTRLLLIPALVFALASAWSIAGCQIAVGLGAFLLAVGLVSGRLRMPRLPLAFWAIFLFLAVQGLSVIPAVFPRRSLLCWKDSWTYLFPLVFWGLLQEESVRKRALAAAGVSGALAGLYGIVQHVWGRDWIHHRMCENYGGGGYVAVGNLNGHLIYGGALLALFFLALGRAFGQGRSGRAWSARKALLYLPPLLIGLGIVFSYARTAWIGLVVGLLFLGFQRGRRPFLIALGSVTAGLVLISVAEPALRHRLFSLVQIGDDPRTRLWQTALRIWADHPWLGAGPGAFKKLFPLYKVPGEYMATMHPHSDILNVLVESGILGALAWIGIWVAFFAETRGVKTWTAQAGRAGVAAMLAGGLGQNFSTDDMVHGVWGFLLAMALAEARAEEEARSGRSRQGSLGRRLERAFKAATLPAAVLLFAGRRGGKKRDTASEGFRGAATPAEPGGAVTPAAGAAAPVPGRILVIRQDNRLGNLLLMTPFLRRLREAAPESRIGFLSGESYAPLLRSWSFADEWIVEEKRRHARHPWEFPGFISGLRAGHWDLAFEASNHNTHSYYQCLLAVLSGAPERIGFDHERSRAALTRAVEPPDEFLPFSLAPLRLLRALGLPAPAAEMECPLPPEPSAAFRDWRAGRPLERGYLVAHLGGRDAKALPLEAWAELLPRLPAELPLVIVAGPSEQDRLASLGSAGAAERIAAPALSVTDLAFLIRGASAFLGCDSGVMHLAVGLGTPTAALFFHSNPYHYAPLGSRHRTVLLADPYGVREEIWGRPVEGFARSPLLRATGGEEASRRGIPETGPRALSAAARAVEEALEAGAEAGNGDPGRNGARQGDAGQSDTGRHGAWRTGSGGAGLVDAGPPFGARSEAAR